MKLSNRKKLLKEADMTLQSLRKEVKKQGSNYVYTSNETEKITDMLANTRTTIYDTITALYEYEKVTKTIDDALDTADVTESELKEMLKAFTAVGKLANNLQKEFTKLRYALGK